MSEEKKKEIYSYKCPWKAYTMAWCRKSEQNNILKMAVSSYKEEYSNQLLILELAKGAAEQTGEAEGASKSDGTEEAHFTKLCEMEHPYPATKIMFAPPKFYDLNLTSANNNAGNTDNTEGKQGDKQKVELTTTKDLFATTGDYLRLWTLDDNNNCELKSVLNNNKHAEYCAPLTCFDWNEANPALVGTCSIDTTCTIWDLNTLTPKTQLIAHDKEVYDLAFATGEDIFGTVGADGSLRMFDLRSLEHSTIQYESPDLTPLLRLAWNKQDPNYIAATLSEAHKAIILDVRVPSVPVTELTAHHACVNGVAWAPQSAHHICTCSDDRQALIWDIHKMPKVIEEPILAYAAEGEINQVQWSGAYGDWVAITFNDLLQILRV